MGGTIDPAVGVRVVAVQASEEVKCVVFDVLRRRVIGINEAYLGTPLWDLAVQHARRHLIEGVDVFTICEQRCPG